MGTITHKITHGENVIQEGEMVFDIKANDGSKFEMEHLHKMTMTEESPFYGMVFWWTGRYGKTVERKMTFVFDKINKSFLFVPKMSMNTVMTIDGEKSSEFVFDNTQAKKHIKFFWAPDAFTKEYLFTDEWEYPAGGCKWTTDLKRGGVSIWNWVGDYSFVNNANKFELKTMDKVVQTPMSPFYGLDHFYVGKYYKNGERTRTITYEKQNRNFLLGKLFVEDKLMLDGERFGHFKLDTRATPYTQAKKHIKFFWAPDAFTKEYLFTDELEYPAGGCKWTTDLKRGGVSIWNWVGDYSFVNNANKFELKTMDK